MGSIREAVILSKAGMTICMTHRMNPVFGKESRE